VRERERERKKERACGESCELITWTSARSLGRQRRRRNNESGFNSPLTSFSLTQKPLKYSTCRWRDPVRARVTIFRPSARSTMHDRNIVRSFLAFPIKFLIKGIERAAWENAGREWPKVAIRIDTDRCDERRRFNSAPLHVSGCTLSPYEARNNKSAEIARKAESGSRRVPAREIRLARSCATPTRCSKATRVEASRVRPAERSFPHRRV